MKKLFTLFAAMASVSVYAQSGSTGALLEESYRFAGDNTLYRYVYAYNKDKERASETIYRKTRNGAVWSEEQLYEIGNYSYQYDSRGRLKVKQVTYTMGQAGDFPSYRIMVDYDDNAKDGITSCYTRYEQTSGSYERTESWSYYANGKLAFHKFYNNGYGSRVSYANDENGNLSEVLRQEYNGEGYEWTPMLTKSGSLNDSTVVYYRSGQPYKAERYKYDHVTGRPLEFACWSTNGDVSRDVWTYDAFGRIATHEYYNDGDDYDVGTGYAARGAKQCRQRGRVWGLTSPERRVKAVAKRSGGDVACRETVPALGDEPQWVLDEKTVYTYATDEAYSFTDSWRRVFNIEGPLKEVVFTERGDEGERDYVNRTTFMRDASGKLTAVDCTIDTVDDDITESRTFTVDADGHIVRDSYYDSESYGDHKYEDDNTTVYTWENGVCVKAEETSVYKGESTSVNVWSHAYEYGDNVFTEWVVNNDGYGTSTSMWEESLTDGNTFRSSYTKLYKSDDYSYTSKEQFIREVQKEDVSFVRPNMMKDVERMEAEEPIVVSLKNRVVTAYKPEGSDAKWGYVSGVYAMRNDNDAYITTPVDEYFSVAHVGDQTVCSDFYGKPVYVLEDGRLVKEFEYLSVNHPAEDNGSVEYCGQEQTRSAGVDVPAGIAYNEINYTYSPNGLLVGQSVVAVGSDGSRTEAVELEYKYDPTTAVGSVEAVAKTGIRLSGRVLGFTDGTSFSVYTLNGQQLAASVTSFVFAERGVYALKFNGKTVKIFCK